MAKIMLAFSAGADVGAPRWKLPIYYESFIKELTNRGNEVKYFAHSHGGPFKWPKAKEDVINQINTFNPDLFIIFNNSFFDIRDTVKCPIIIFGADSYLIYANLSDIQETPSRFLFFCTEETGSYLKTIGVKEQQICPYVHFSSVQAKAMKIADNIVIIGSKFSYLKNNLSNQITAFLQTRPNDNERREYAQALAYLKKNPYDDIETLKRKGILQSPTVIKFFISNIWVVNLLSDEIRISLLAAVADLGLKIYGTSNWAEEYYYQSELMLCYSSKKIWTLQENADVYNSAKIGISVGHLQAVNGFPWRTLDIMNSNACLVTDYHKDFDKLIPKNLFPVYHDCYEARTICKELLQDEEKRLRIVENCQKYAKENFGFERVAEALSKLSGVTI